MQIFPALRRWSVRRTLQKLHLWVALLLTVPFIMLGITGSILAFHHELLALETPVLKGASTGPAKPAGEIAAAALAAVPGCEVKMVNFPEEPGEAAMVRLAARPHRAGQASGAAQASGGAPAGAPPAPAGPGGGTQVLIDPATLAVLFKRGPDDPQSPV